MNDWHILLVVILSLGIGAAIGRFGERQYNKRKIQKLNLTLDTIMHGNLSADLSPYQEGEYSILVNQLEMLVKRTAHMVDQLNKEKIEIHDFIADISHQIKTPLTGLLSYLDLLERGEADAGKKAQLTNCIYLAERMGELVQALLELARLDSGLVSLHIEDVIAEELLLSAKQAAVAARPNAGASFQLDSMASFQLDATASFRKEAADKTIIRCDRKWLGQALVNVLVNALDYSPDGTFIQITVRQKDGVTVIKVLDHSGGMAEAELPHIFKRFYRAGNSKKGGFGIGLSMAESIVNLHKGNIRAVNEGDGLAIILTLPHFPCAETL